MKISIRKLALALTTIIIGLNLIAVTNLAFADDPATSTAEEKTPAIPLKELQFQTTKYLNLGKDKDGQPLQTQSYFGSKTADGKDQTPFPLTNFILIVINTATKIAGTLDVILMIITGMVMVLSQGSQNTVEKAKQMFTYEILGIVVILLSYVAVTFVQSLLTTST